MQYLGNFGEAFGLFRGDKAVVFIASVCAIKEEPTSRAPPLTARRPRVFSTG